MKLIDNIILELENAIPANEIQPGAYDDAFVVCLNDTQIKVLIEILKDTKP